MPHPTTTANHSVHTINVCYCREVYREPPPLGLLLDGDPALLHLLLEGQNPVVERQRRVLHLFKLEAERRDALLQRLACVADGLHALLLRGDLFRDVLHLRAEPDDLTLDLVRLFLRLGRLLLQGEGGERES